MKRIRWDLVVALALVVAHIIAVWGYTGLWWGDIGRWSHEVERFAAGELPYRDFQWHYPPLGLWVEGFAARLVGTDRDPLGAINAVLAILIVLAYVRYARQVAKGSGVGLMAVALVLALAYAQRIGAPLPMGLYSPALIVGTLCIALAATEFLRSLEPGQEAAANWMGLFAGLAVLSKQDFWFPAAFLVAAVTIRSRRPGPAAVSAAVTAAGVVVIVWTAGIGILSPLVGGFGHAELAGGQGFPSWERLTVDFFVVAMICGTYAVLVSVATRKLQIWPLVACGAAAALTGGLHLYQSMTTTLPQVGELLTPTQEALAYQLRNGDSLFRPALGWLRRRVTQNPIPLALPPLLLLMMARSWRALPDPRRTMIALLLGFAVAFRVRRGWWGTEWSEFLFTLPVLVVGAEMLLALPGSEQRRLRQATVGVLVLGALWANWEFGRGIGTRYYYPEATATLRGEVQWKPEMARDYRHLLATVDSLDPSRERPVFAFGVTGGVNYFLNRRNPFPYTQNFFFSAFDPDSVLRQIPSRLILVDNPFLEDGSFQRAGFNWDGWEGDRVAAPYHPFDRPHFDRLRAGCRQLPADSSLFRVYDCP